jgi:hypothetical protein
MTRPSPTGDLASLVDDLVSWWHCYGAPEGGTLDSRKAWEYTGEQLPVSLDEAARLFVDHAYATIVSRIREAHQQAWRDLSATLPPETGRAVTKTSQAQRELFVRRWPIDSPEPQVPKGFIVRRPKEVDDRNVWFEYDGVRWVCRENDRSCPEGFQGQRYPWVYLNASDGPFPGSELIEELPPGPRMWIQRSPEPDMPAGFTVQRTGDLGLRGGGPIFIRRADAGTHRWESIQGAGFAWEDINRAYALVEVC